VTLLMHTELAPDSEPRVQVPPLERPPVMDHPFFWAGYLVADTGGDPHRSAEPDAAAAPPDVAAPAAKPPATTPPAEAPATEPPASFIPPAAPKSDPRDPRSTPPP
jgi:hypothetical protein